MVISFSRCLFGVALLSATLMQPALAQFPGNASAGEKVYKRTCVVCHGTDGTGAIPGAPNFTDKKSPLVTESHKVLLEHVLNGFTSPGSTMSMPPKGGNEDLTIRDIQNVLKYMHEKFGYTLGGRNKH